MKKIKQLANKWYAERIEYSAMDIKLHLGLDVCTATIMNALTSEGPVRWGIAWADEGTGATFAACVELVCCGWCSNG